MKNTTRTTAAIALALSLTLAGCADTDDDAGSGAAEVAQENADVNEADVMFATMMLPHHEQAIEMSDIVLEKDDVDPDVRALAEQIKAAQGPEIEQLEGWLEEWGADADDMGSMDHGDHGSMSGMMSEADLEELRSADGQEASRLFLEQMIEHHRGAVEMAETQVEDGRSPEAVELARTIVETQNEEIEQMESLLQTL